MTPTAWRDVLAASWSSYWFSLDQRRLGPAWLHWVWTTLFCALIALGFTLMNFISWGRFEWSVVSDLARWYRVNFIVSFAIGAVIHMLFELAARLLGHRRIGAFGTGRRVLFYGGVPLAGVLIGWPLGAWLALGRLPFTFDNIATSLLFTLTLTSVISFYYAARARQLAAEKRATEAQLRLLQGQIEPHFLFNTLANVQALIDQDAPKAKRMLEALTDHLRASLVALRGDRATLASELDGVRAYLALMQTRMEDRLDFAIADPGPLRDVRLPALALQPLVENAIHHGLEPKVSGGRIDIGARSDGSTLVVTIDDDGLGLAAAAGAPRRRKGAGLALANLRERLAARYGDAAALTVEDRNPGTRVLLRVPLETHA